MAGSDGRAYAVRRAGARTLWTDRRVRRQRTGDVRTRRTADVRTVGRLRRVRRIRSLGCGWRVCGRVRPPRALVRQGGGGGCAKIAVPWYPMRSVSLNFFAKGGLCRAGIVAVCVFPSKKIRPPRVRTPCRPVPRGKRLPPRRKKKIHARPAGGITGAWRRERRPKKTARP